MVTSALASRLLQDGLDMHRRGAVAEAAARYSQILTFEPKNVDALCLLGVAKMELKGFPEAVDLLRKVVKLAPKHAPAHNFLGTALKQTGRTEAALASFTRAISHQPDLMDAYVNRADLLMALNRWAEAVETYDRALAVRPTFFQGWCNRGVALERMGRLEDAIASHDRALALRADLTAAHANRGNALAALGRHQAAVESFDRALATNPDFAEIHLNRGNSLTRLARREEALASYERALAIRSDMAEAHFGRAVVYRDQTWFDDEVQCLDRAIEFNRNDAVRAVYHMYRAEALNQLGRFEEAFAEVERALQVAPDDDQILFGVSLIELLHGRWLEGWRKYERRIPLKVGIPDGFSPPAWPPWRGEPLQEELLVLRGEQGLGDHLMFSCFAADLAKRGHRIALWVKPGLQPLLQTVPWRGAGGFRPRRSRGLRRRTLGVDDERARTSGHHARHGAPQRTVLGGGARAHRRLERTPRHPRLQDRHCLAERRRVAPRQAALDPAARIRPALRYPRRAPHLAAKRPRRRGNPRGRIRRAHRDVGRWLRRERRCFRRQRRGHDDFSI